MSKAKIRTYSTTEIEVSYDVQRCIHAEECVRGLPAVFNTTQRPWVQPGNAPAGEVAEIVMRCPTGALHFERLDGGAPEPVPLENTIQLAEDGPLYIRGEVKIFTPGGELIFRDTRIGLCRCGASAHKPFCDNSHRDIDFVAAADLSGKQETPAGFAPGGPLEIQPSANGPYHLKGNFAILNGAGQVVFQGQEAWFCRCGGSQNKPFCDGTHNKIGFRANS